jgi:hypothetical protein
VADRGGWAVDLQPSGPEDNRQRRRRQRVHLRVRFHHRTHRVGPDADRGHCRRLDPADRRCSAGCTHLLRAGGAAGLAARDQSIAHHDALQPGPLAPALRERRIRPHRRYAGLGALAGTHIPPLSYTGDLICRGFGQPGYFPLLLDVLALLAFVVTVFWGACAFHRRWRAKGL